MALSSDQLAARIVEGAADAILFTDRGGVIRLWSGGAERIFGWTAAEAVGQSMDLIIPERLRPRHWENWDRVMETGQTRYSTDVLAVPALRKDGAPLSIEFTIQLIRDETGAIVGPAALIRDVTARFAREKELRARLRAYEATQGRREAHDAVTEPGARGASSGGVAGGHVEQHSDEPARRR